MRIIMEEDKGMLIVIEIGNKISLYFSYRLKNE
jgi:hypothetical protein